MSPSTPNDQNALPHSDALPHVDALPHWEEVPSDIAAATRTIKAAIRKRMADMGRPIEVVIAEAEAFLLAEVSEVETLKTQGKSVWPVLNFEDIEHGTVPEKTYADIKRRGCAIIRNTFDRAQAEQWDQQIVDYVDRNNFAETYTGPADDFFGSVKSKPEIYPIYWSTAQMEARQHPRMAATQSFMNRMWTYERDGNTFFDPDRGLAYPDRIRRRPPGTSSGGLGTHLDTGTLDLWMNKKYQQHFSQVFEGDFASYDPWDAAHRTEAMPFGGSTMCSVFRTFQGWTALSEMRSDQGVLHSIPIPKALAYLLLRALLDDVAEDDLCGVRLGRAFPVTREWHDLLTPAISAIPDVHPGDTAWWHCDLIHSVAPVTDQQGWGNVMYIPAAPRCAKNERYANTVRTAFLTGSSPDDFPEEHYERAWDGRFGEDQLNDIGRMTMNMG
jgi:Protein of unknown function (DUF1479)